MEKYVSKTVEDDVSSNELEIAFDFVSGDNDIVVKDELITNYETAKARAESIFLEKSYKVEAIEISTYYQNGLEIGDIILIDNLRYKIVDISLDIEKVKAEMNIIAKRWYLWVLWPH